MESFIQLDQVPDGLLDVRANELHRLLAGPALIHLTGRRPSPLFVSILLHGNETTGLGAVQAVLKKYAGQPLPRSLSIFIGNVQAARLGLRRLDHQLDFNRIWPGHEQAPCVETAMAQTVFDEMAQRGVFVSIDVHNNTGANPHYACLDRLDEQTLQLAVMFGRLMIHSTCPKGTQSGAFARLCPSVTLECGKPGQPFGTEHAVEFIDSCLHLADIPQSRPPLQDMDLLRSIAQVTVRGEVRFSYSDTHADLLLRKQLDRLNFTELSPGEILGYLNGAAPALPLIARDAEGRDVAPDYFCIEGNKLMMKKSAIPSMITLDEHIIRQDCLCYLMERIVAAPLLEAG